MNAAHLFQRIAHYYCALPVWDYWRTAENLNAYKRFDLAVLWHQHNEHRIILPELIYAADALLMHARQVLPIASSTIFYLCTFIVIAASFWPDKRITVVNRSIAVLLGAIVVLWQGVATVLADSFLIQWTLLQFAVACTLVFLCLAKAGGGNKYLVLSIFAAAAGTYTSGNGLFIWPILIACAFLIGLDRKSLLMLGAAAIVFCGTYFIGYRFTKETNPFLIVQHPLYFFQFVGAYLGMPFAVARNVGKPPIVGELLGWLNLASVMAVGIALWRRRLLGLRAPLVLFGTYAFTLCTILITAAGRMQINDPTIFTALASRYLSVPLMNWAVAILIWFWFAGLSRGAAIRVPVFGLLLAGLLAIGFARLRPWLADDATYYANYQMAALGLEDGLMDPSIVHRIFHDVEPVVRWSRELQENNLSIYYKPMSRWLGKNVDRYAGINETPVPGAIAYSYPLMGGIEIAGWADESTISRAYRWVLLTNEQGQIVGIGEKLPAGFPRDLSAWEVPPSLGWIGFVNLRYRAKYVSAYLVDNRRPMLLRLQAQYELPVVEGAGIEQIGPAVGGLEWSGTGPWVQGHIPAPLKGPSPRGKIYSSWGASDRDLGEWHSSAFETPAAACLILPVLHGPRVEGLSVTVVDADSHAVIANAPMQDGMTDWNFWRIQIPAATKRIQVNASDNGIGWGEWVALTDPATCR